MGRIKKASNSNRLYGYGAVGRGLNAVRGRKSSVINRLKYNFDNSLSRSWAFAGYLAIAALVLALLMTFVKFILLDESGTFVSKYWDSVSKILKVGKGATWNERGIEIMFWVISVAISGSVIGYITNNIAQSIQRLKQGESPIIEGNHILILGWSSRIFPVLHQLSVANENVKNPLVVIFSVESRELMDRDIASHAYEYSNLRVITRCGNPTSPHDLKRSNIEEARTVIVLDSEVKDEAKVITTVMSAKSQIKERDIPIVAELQSAEHTKTLNNLYQGEVVCVRSQDIITSVTAQASRLPGLSRIVVDILDFEGDEIYFAKIRQTSGKTYRETLLSFKKACVIGFIDADGFTHLNPDPNTILSAKDTIIAIAEDDDRIIWSPVNIDFDKIKLPSKKEDKLEMEHLLIIGWSSAGYSVMEQLVPFIAKGSTIHIIVLEKYIEITELENLKYTGIKITFETYDGDLLAIKNAVTNKSYNHIVVLGYREHMSDANADTQTLLTMVQLNKLFKESEKEIQDTRIVSEILDSRNADLANFVSSGELVVSDILTAVTIAQLSENIGLEPIFNELFNADGASLSMKPIEHYAELGEKISFGELVAVASMLGESAIGYRRGSLPISSDEAVQLNPTKGKQFTPYKGDTLAVICEIKTPNYKQ